MSANLQRDEREAIHETLLYVRDEVRHDRGLIEVRHAIDEAVGAIERAEDPGHRRRNARAFVLWAQMAGAALLIAVWLYLMKSSAGIDLDPEPSFLHGLYEIFRGPPAGPGASF